MNATLEDLKAEKAALKAMQLEAAAIAASIDDRDGFEAHRLRVRNVRIVRECGKKIARLDGQIFDYGITNGRA